MKQRPILVATIGYIIGILGGLYFKSSIVLYYIPLLATYYIQKKFFSIHKKRKIQLISFRRYCRYLKLIINQKVILILILSSILSNTIVLWQNKNYKTAFQDGEMIQITGIVVSQKIEKQYYNLYQVKPLDTNNLYLYIQVDKKLKLLEYGDKIKIQGEYKAPSTQRNYGGYDDENYLKTLKIVGRVKAKQVMVISQKQLNPILQFANRIKQKGQERIEKNIEEKKAGILQGLLLGDTTQIQEEVKDNFKVANISHILAISGMHITYIIMGVQLFFKRIIGKRNTKIITIILLILYLLITGFSPSIIRAIIMGIITLGSSIWYRKSDVWNAMAISLLGTLVYNPFLILNVGLQLSYFGTIGIVLFCPMFLKILNKIPFLGKTKEMIAVSLSAQITILPILLYHFNTFGIYFLFTNLLVSLIIGPIIILGFLSVLVPIVTIPVSIGLDFLNLITNFSQLPLSKIYLPTPHISSIICYYLGILAIHKIYFIYHTKKSIPTYQRIKNLIALLRYRFCEKKRVYLGISIIITILVFILLCLPKNLRIYFVDVGQGDCTFLITPQNKTVLVDGGGSLRDDFDVGRKTLIPYLLDRGYTTIDYIMISHFDQDHVGGLLSVMEEIKVKNVIIAKQGEDSKQYQKFIEIVKEKKIKVLVVEQGNKIAIEKEIYFDILWPKNQLMSENALNNNSIVAKLNYKDFSVLFTGDVESVAEKAICEEYKNLNTLKATILKVAHHGSKTSSTQEMLKAVYPKIALIGVGANNTFGHPNNEVIESLKKCGTEIYRTDERGEILMVVEDKGKIKLTIM